MVQLVMYKLNSNHTNIWGKKGISVQLLAVQVLNLKEYAGSDKLEFAAIDTDKEII